MGEYLKNKRCYLSGPIESDNDRCNWRDEPKRILTKEFGLDVFDPHSDPKQQKFPLLAEARKNKDYETMRNIAKDFVHKDLAVVDRSDFVIAYLPLGVPTTGTVHEIIVSSNNKKPTLLICPQGKEMIPYWYYGFIPHQVMFGSWEELYNHLREVNNGMYKDNYRWSFVYGLI
jgi:nucleoside 2-deoxyribosyltransferase